MDLLKIYNGGNHAHAHVSSVYNFCSSSNLIKYIRTFIRQFLKSNNMGLLKIHNGGNNSHAQDSTVITSVGIQIQLNLQESFTSMISFDLRCAPMRIFYP